MSQESEAREEAFLERRLNARLSREDRDLARIERRENAADKMIGELCRDGKTIFYVQPVGGRYREGTRRELIDFLMRNKYV